MTLHIRSKRKVPLNHVGQKGKLMNVLHVPTITKNLVSVGEIVDQGIQVRFTHLGCFIEEEGQVIAQGCSDERMFILDTNELQCHRNVREGTKNRVGHRLMAQADRPRQLSKASRLAIETSGVRIAQILVAVRHKFAKPAS